MARRVKITRADLQEAADAIASSGVKVRSARVIAERLTMKAVNQTYDNYESYLRGVGATQEELHQFREAFIEQLVRGENLLPEGTQSAYQSQFSVIYNKALDVASTRGDFGIVSEREQARIVKAQMVQAQKQRRVRQELNYLSEGDNYRAVYLIFDQLKSFFVDADKNKAHGGIVAYRDWYYQYMVRGSRNIDWNQMSKVMTDDELLKMAEYVRKSDRDEYGKPINLSDDIGFMSLVSDVADRLVDSALVEQAKHPSIDELIDFASR